jgi:prephenate dehydrogenase
MLERVVVVGCGLIGGSIVRALRERALARSVAAIDRAEVLAEVHAEVKAYGQGWLDEGAEPGSEAARRLVATAKLVVLAAPIGTIVGTLAQVLDQVAPDAAVTDCGSVKRPMLELAARHARGDRFVAGHPMAGRELGGFSASKASLFEGRRWYVVPGRAAADARDQVVALIRALGALPVEKTAEAHDRAMAYVSHAPQLVASALVDVAEATGCLAEAGPGFDDTTRVAGGPEGIWRDILEANGGNVREALDALIERLVTMREELGAAGAGGGRALEKTLGVLARARRARGR